MKLHVETFTPPADEVQPTGFFLGNRHIDVAQVVDRWPSADHIYFKVEAKDGSTYILRHDEAPDQWEMTYFEAPHPVEIPLTRGGRYLS
jgi:hypothetical protein